MEEYLKLGDVYRLCGISSETLRRYEKAGLIRPAAVKENGRRFYSMSQIRILNILCLGKDLGISPGKAKETFEGEIPAGYRSLIAEQKNEIERQRRRLRLLEEKADTALCLLSAAENSSSDPRIPQKKTTGVTLYFPGEIADELMPFLSCAELWTSPQAESVRTGIAFSDPDAERKARKYLRNSEKIGFHGTFSFYSFYGTEKELEDFSVRTAAAHPGVSVWIRHLFLLPQEDGAGYSAAEIYLI